MANVEVRTSEVMAVVMTTTTIVGVTGTLVTAAAQPAMFDSGPIAKNASVRILHSRRATTPVQATKEVVPLQNGLATAGVTMQTTTAYVVGIKVTAAGLLATSFSFRTAKSARAVTHQRRRQVARGRAIVVPRYSLVTVGAMT